MKPNEFDRFAEEEYEAYTIYRELAKIESNVKVKNLLKTLSKKELEHYRFWSKFSSKKSFSVNPLKILLVKIVRIIFGLVFIIKFLESGEGGAIEEYTNFMKKETGGWNKTNKRRLEWIIDDENHHEKAFSSCIKEERIKFISSIILGLNDALIELTGIFFGLSFTLHNNILVAISGLVAGIAAALSMAASSYMQAIHEIRKDAKKAALYTGISYITVVFLLAAPFFFMNNSYNALILMFAVEIVIIATISYYTSIILGREFKIQFGRILLFSIGVAIIAFIIGSSLRLIMGIDV
jgi:VIT1/CCC1 family predicted Fe2+/Mn2+ transporter